MVIIESVSPDCGNQQEFCMSRIKKMFKPTVLVLALTSGICVSGTARAETGWLWFDSVFAARTAAPAPAVKRAKVVRPTIVTASAQPIRVSLVAPESGSDCFWCSRRIYISGLSF